MFRLRRPRPFMRPMRGPVPPPVSQHPHRAGQHRLAAKVESLLNSAEPADRLHAIDLLALRPHHPRVQAALNQVVELDPEPTVREAARAVLQHNALQPVMWSCPACHAVDLNGPTCPYCATARPHKALSRPIGQKV